MSDPQTSETVQTLTAVIDKAAGLIERVRPEQWSAPTPCTDWDVQQLLRHLVGWADTFADRSEGVEPAPDPDSVDLGDDPASTFRAAGERIVRARTSGEEVPESAPTPEILVAEYVLHGWDLATATGQPVPYADSEAAVALPALREMLLPEYRGYGFDDEVQVPEDAGEVQQLIAFSGRNPVPAS